MKSYYRKAFRKSKGVYKKKTIYNIIEKWGFECLSFREIEPNVTKVNVKYRLAFWENIMH